jgi:4'-phosphopantetheinyl transferase
MNSAEVFCSIPEGLLDPIHSPEDGVQVWVTHLDSIPPNDIVELRSSLDSEEHRRAARFRFERDRQRYVATRGLLRCLLGAALDTPPSALVFEYGSHGKPEIARDHEERKLRFNVSHAAGLAIFATAWERHLGVDLESLDHLAKKPADLFDFAMRVFSPREFEIWRALRDNATRRRALLRAWTRKEAYLKATGEGLRAELNRVEVALDATEPARSLTLRNCRLHDLPSPPGFAAALGLCPVEQ